MYGRETEIEPGGGVLDARGEPITPGPLTLELGASGWTYQGVFILHDRQTGSLWYPYPAVGGLLAINGPLEGTVLEAMEGAITTWNDWVDRHPDSLLLTDR